MFELPQPPQPPQNSQETLEQLEAYYQKTIEYYSQALALSQKKLRAIQILLERDTQAETSPQPQPFQQKQKNQSSEKLALTFKDAKNPAPFLNETQQKDNAQNPPLEQREGQLSLLDNGYPLETSIVPTSTPNTNERYRGTPVSLVEPFEENSRQVSSPILVLPAIEPQVEEESFEQIAPKILKLLESNSGKILQLDYLIRKLYGQVEPKQISLIKPQVRSLLEKGERQKLWAKVPDAPNCWTIDLTLLPDFAPQESPEPKNLKVDSPSQTVVAAIGLTLKNVAPKALKPREIFELLCPPQTSVEPKNYFFNRVLGFLSGWKKQPGWRRLKQGLYVWDENFPASQANHHTSVEDFNSAAHQNKLNNCPTPPSKLKPNSDKPTILTAISQTLKNATPNPLKAREIFEIICPEQISQKKKKSFYKRVMGLLSEGQNQCGWIRVKQGFYVWDENFNSSQSNHHTSVEDSQSTTHQNKLSNCPTSPSKLEPNSDTPTILTAIENILKNAAPHPLKAVEIFELLCPERISQKKKKSFYKRLMRLLSQGHKQGSWIRVKTGFYIWDENFRANQANHHTTVEDSQSSVNQEDSPSSVNQNRFKNLPNSPQFERYGTLLKTIVTYLKQKARQAVTANDLLDWLYPEALEPTIREKAYASLSKTLNYYAGYKWLRIEDGFYTWDEPFAAFKNSRLASR